MDQFNQDFSSLGVNQILLCQKHKQKYAYLWLEPQEKEISPLRCPKCITANNLNPSKLLSLEEIMNCDQNIILDNWPLFGSKNNMFQYLNVPIQFQDMSNFFKCLKQQFNNQISSIEDKLKRQYEKMEQNRQLIILYYNQISLKQKLQTSLSLYPSNTKISIQQLNECISTVSNQRQKIDKDFSSIYTSLNYYKDYLSTYSLGQFQKSIQQVVDSMEKVVSYEIYDLLTKDDNQIIALEQREGFNNNVYYGIKEFLYSSQNIKNRLNLINGCLNSNHSNNNINNNVPYLYPNPLPYNSIYQVEHSQNQNQICICQNCSQLDRLHTNNNKFSAQNLLKLNLIS